MTTKSMIVIKYPPDFDGELHINVEGKDKGIPSYTYTFTHAAKGDEWATLVKAAEGILAQNRRMLSKATTRRSK